MTGTAAVPISTISVAGLQGGCSSVSCTLSTSDEEIYLAAQDFARSLR